jgi:hypothetical protein
MKIQSTKLLAKIVIAVLGLSFLLVSFFEILGTTLYFSFYLENEMPYHRLQALRITIFLTFSYFSFRYLIYESVRMYPIQFLDIMLKIYMLTALIIFINNDVEMREYFVIVAIFFISIISHIASRPKLRRYYYSKFTNTKN